MTEALKIRVEKFNNETTGNMAIEAGFYCREILDKVKETVDEWTYYDRVVSPTYFKRLHNLIDFKDNIVIVETLNIQKDCIESFIEFLELGYRVLLITMVVPDELKKYFQTLVAY